MSRKWSSDCLRFWSWREWKCGCENPKKQHCCVRFLNFLIGVIGLASLSIALWVFGLADGLYAKVATTGLFAVIPIFQFINLIQRKKDDSQTRGLDQVARWFALLSVVSMLIMAAAEFDSPSVSVGVGLILASLFQLAIFWMIVRGRRMRILLLASIPTTFVALLYLGPSSTESLLDYLVPLPIVSVAAIVWAFVVRGFLNLAQAHKRRSIWGPAAESVFVLSLVAPFIVLAMLTVDALGAGDIWVAVSGVFVGIMFGGAVSEPIKDLLRDLAELSKSDRCGCESGALEEK